MMKHKELIRRLGQIQSKADTLKLSCAKLISELQREQEDIQEHMESE